MKVIDHTEPETYTRKGRVNLGHKGNGDPNRPSVIKRREARAAERKRQEKNRKARERRAAAKA